ncbi:MAG: hypothetical protein ABWY14_01950 [Tardiphaga sp.]
MKSWRGILKPIWLCFAISISLNSPNHGKTGTMMLTFGMRQRTAINRCDKRKKPGSREPGFLLLMSLAAGVSQLYVVDDDLPDCCPARSIRGT